MRRLLVLILVVAVLAGCDPGAPSTLDNRADLTESELVGTWQNTAHNAVLVFEEDGRFAATVLPHQVFEGIPGVLPDGFDPERDTLDGSGQWSLGASREDRDGPRNLVTLHLRRLAGRTLAGSVELRAEKEGSSPVLAFYLGDPDLGNRYVYRKCQAGCPTVAPR